MLRGGLLLRTAGGHLRQRRAGDGKHGKNQGRLQFHMSLLFAGLGSGSALTYRTLES
jgi:hypothetical protein